MLIHLSKIRSIIISMNMSTKKAFPKKRYKVYPKTDSYMKIMPILYEREKNIIDVANYVGVTIDAIYKILKGKSKSEKLRGEIAKFLGVNIEDIWRKE